MRLTQLALFASLALSSIAAAQTTDSLAVGDRVRVRVPSTRGNTNLFIGNVASLSTDTLTLELPGGKGTVILPRVGIAEVGKAAGRESRFRNLPMAWPFLASTVMFATLPPVHGGSHSRAINNQRYLLIGLSAMPLISMFMRTPPERWEATTRWLEGHPR